MCDDLTPSERAAVLTMWLVLGWQPTTAEVAQRLGIKPIKAWRILDSLGRVVPVVLVGRRWMWIGDK